MAKNKKDNRTGQKRPDKPNAEGQLPAEAGKNEPAAESKKRNCELDF